ncbi:MAG: RNA-binding protein [Ignavibacteriaceae bacterium]|jgi:RNA recognition motif-containing protein
MNIYVGNLSREVSDEDLMTEFSAYGKVKSVKVIRDLFSGDSKGFGFVEMVVATEAQKAIDELNTKEVKGKKLVVNEARPKTDDRRGGGGGRGGFRGGSGSGGGGNRGGGSGGFGGPRKRF